MRSGRGSQGCGQDFSGEERPQRCRRRPFTAEGDQHAQPTPYWRFSIKSPKHKGNLVIGVGNQAGAGPDHTTRYTTALKPHIKQWGVSLWSMTGILAGIEGMVNVADVVVAESATSIAGKMKFDEETKQQVLSAEATTSILRTATAATVKHLHASPELILKHLLPFQVHQGHGKCLVDYHPLAGGAAAAACAPGAAAPAVHPLPPAMRECVIDLLSFLAGAAPSCTMELVQQHATTRPYWQFLENVLQCAASLGLIKGFALTPKGEAKLAEEQEKHQYRTFPQPIRTDRAPAVVVGPVVSTGFVREDLAEATKVIVQMRVQSAQRKLVAVEMEIAAFYACLADLSIERLAVKGVCDFGDTYKDDNHHESAAFTSAAFLRAFVEQRWEYLINARRTGAAGRADEQADDDFSMEGASSSAAAAAGPQSDSATGAGASKPAPSFSSAPHVIYRLVGSEQQNHSGLVMEKTASTFGTGVVAQSACFPVVANTDDAELNDFMRTELASVQVDGAALLHASKNLQAICGPNGAALAAVVCPRPNGALPTCLVVFNVTSSAGNGLTSDEWLTPFDFASTDTFTGEVRRRALEPDAVAPSTWHDGRRLVVQYEFVSDSDWVKAVAAAKTMTTSARRRSQHVLYIHFGADMTRVPRPLADVLEVQRWSLTASQPISADILTRLTSYAHGVCQQCVTSWSNFVAVMCGNGRSWTYFLSADGVRNLSAHVGCSVNTHSMLGPTTKYKDAQGRWRETTAGAPGARFATAQ